MFRPVGRNIELNSEGIGAKSAVVGSNIELKRGREPFYL